MSDDDHYITDDGLKDFALSLLIEVIDLGESESAVLSQASLKPDEEKAIMKANAMLAVLAMTLVKLVNTNNVAVTKMLYEVWNSPDLNDMLAIAFEDERAEARELMDELVAKLEDAANEEDDDASTVDDD